MSRGLWAGQLGLECEPPQVSSPPPGILRAQKVPVGRAPQGLFSDGPGGLAPLPRPLTLKPTRF